MAEDFAALGRLKRLRDDAERAAAVLEKIDDESAEASKSPEKVVDLATPVRSSEKHEAVAQPPAKRSRKTPSFQQQPVAEQQPPQPVSLSTLILSQTKRRLARVAHLQAASELLPNTQWEIVDQAINEWCDKRGYE
jgi:hypothetical protein